MAEVKKKKKKRRRYRINWPWLNKSSTKPKKARKKLKLRKEVYLVLVGIIFICALIFIPRTIEKNNLKDLGYTNTEISAIREQKLASTLIDNSYYSKYLANSITDGTLNTDYLSLYTVIGESGSLTSKDFLLYNRLLDKGYVESQLLNLFKNLYFYEMTPLRVFDYQYDETTHIDICFIFNRYRTLIFTEVIIC